MAIANNQHTYLHAEISRLQQVVQRLEQENRDLQVALANTAEHGDCIEATLCENNSKLQIEVTERRRAELTLKSLLSLISKQRDDLEIILETLIEHGDVLDTQWQQKVSQANVLASSDGLTQIANRRRFDEYLAEQWVWMARSYSFLSVLMCDVDFFKGYNDYYGHLAGDTCLKQVAQSLTSTLYRSPDLLARYGGEEFAAILPQTNVEQALNVAQRMQAAIAQIQIPHERSPIASYLTISIGIASVIPLEPFSPSLLLDETDRQLYRAKHQGRNQIVHTTLNPFADPQHS
ncbi:MAG: diguanylate cyclase [Acaryochloridaceae cyanobacterium CSU_3_4]|nr:diguanylate cyclase [Acaryochloris sp. SU_5_25]NJN38780.1 diguanylate cyclase [Acaryochloridaceae cyanobacterium CSU_3_4]